MKKIAHRGIWSDPVEQNTWPSFTHALECGWGIETDIRSFRGELFLSHDPIIDAQKLVPLRRLLEAAKSYPGQALFLNVKEDGLVPFLNPDRSLIEALDVVFFDMSVPELLKYATAFAPSQLATRFSEFETRPAAAELVDWLWVDSFKKDTDLESLRPFVQLQGKSLAFVSPEIHGRNPKPYWDLIENATWIPKNRLALCTDLPGELP